MIGVDGADYLITNWLMDRGCLPNLKALARTGAWGPMRSTLPPLTPPAWTTMMTGKNPGKHGVFDFLSMSGGGLHAPLATRRRAKTLFRALSDGGYRVGTLNLPATYPPEPLSGFQVSGFDVPAFTPALAYPHRSYDILRELTRGFAPFPGPPLHAGDDELEIRDNIDLVTLATRRLLQAFPCDVYMTNFQVVDWAQHRALPREMEAGNVASLDLDGLVAKTYRLVDERIGALVREWTSRESHVMVVSDHGGALVDCLVNMEKLFLDRGLITYKSAATGKSSGLAVARYRARVAVTAWNALKRFSPWQGRVLAPFARRMRRRISAYQADTMVDWSHTVAAPWGLYGQVRLNLKGRDPEGIVSEKDRAKVVARVREAILAVTDPVTQQRGYRDVIEADTVYSGPFQEDGPDLIALATSGRYLTVCGRTFSSGSPPLIDAQEHVAVPLATPQGFHSSVGIFGMAGPRVAAGGSLAESRLEDFAPTALHLLDEAVPSDMDGKPVVEAFTAQAREEHPVRGGYPWPTPEVALEASPLTDEEQRRTEERLRALGYL
jgi:predicted AlkP superfamily phosphohydrolase/phosphomutase